MNGADRVTLVALLWFAIWIGAGNAIGRVFDVPGTGTVCGFLFAAVSVFLWPWVLPSFIDDWMDGPLI